MKKYEKKSLITFIAVYFVGFLMIFIILATIYFKIQQSKLLSEARMEQRVKYVECKTIYKSKKICSKYLSTKIKIDTKEIKRQILYSFFIMLVVISPFIILLGLFSLKPVRKANQLLDSMMEQISHDINTPMSSIIINANSIKNKTDGNLQNKASRIVQSAQQIKRMQENLQALILQEKRAVHKQKIDLKIIINDAIEMLNTKYKDIDIQFNNKNLIVEVDKNDMHRVFVNIIENAIKYNKNNNSIIITIDKYDVSIQDNGIGINNVNKIFDNYYRESTSIPGLGIGLAASYQLCKQNSCTLDITSKLNIGTTVILKFQGINKDV